MGYEGRHAKKKHTYLVADTESIVPKSTLITGETYPDREKDIDFTETWVWAWSIAHIDEEKVKVGNDISTFFTYVEKLNNPIIFFHNLSWDFHFIIAHLVLCGYSFIDDKTICEEIIKCLKEGKEPPEKNNYYDDIPDYKIRVMANSQGSVYEVCFKWKKTFIKLRDSLKLLPMSVDNIGKNMHTKHRKSVGTVDYSATRVRGQKLTPVEIDYCRNDVLVVAEALKMLDDIDVRWRNSLTIGSLCMRSYLDTYGVNNRVKQKKYYRGRFPALDRDLDHDLRVGYRGGWCFVNPTIEDKVLKNISGYVYDVNSLYPSVMYDNVYPCGLPLDGNFTINDALNSGLPFFVSMYVAFKVKDRKFPFLQEKLVMFRESTHIFETEEPIEVTLSRPDYELLIECYDITAMHINHVWVFNGCVAPFNDYIDKWINIKQESTINGNKALRLFSKLMLNNLYGKLAQSPVTRSKQFKRVDNGYTSEDYFEYGEGGYIPAGAYITAYARGVIVRAANNNYDNFLYSDTDSLHLSAPAIGLDIDSVKLGAWDEESHFTSARFVRQKTYCEIDRDNNVIIKAAGCPEVTKKRICYKVSDYDPMSGEYGHFRELTEDSERYSNDEILERFTYGLVEAGKLRRTKVIGGAALVDTTFKIHRGVAYGGEIRQHR